ncbi:MAG TPA: serine hydrolase domain-containing protein [Thermoanaerobaculia bacterium]
MFRLVWIVAAALLLGTPAHPDDKAAGIDPIFSWATSDSPGCTVAVSHEGKLVARRAYGAADLERTVPLNPDSVFDIGSLQKQFVAAAVLLLVDDGRLALSDDVRKYMPELPDYGHTITVDHLLTHTSGLRDWTGLLMFTEGSVEALSMILRQRGLNSVPGEEFSYSNSGYVLAKEIVARVSGTTFAEFSRKRLFEALGMKSTFYSSDTREVIRNRALGYDRKAGSWKLDMLLDKDRGGGAVFSTSSDLLLWNDALTSKRLGALVSMKLEEPAVLNNGKRLTYGRGLFLDAGTDTKVLWHSGSAAGYKALLARFPEDELSIAILCNSGDGTDRIAFARRIVDLYTGRNREDSKSDRPEAIAIPDLNNRTGLFFNEANDEPLRLIADAGRIRVAGGPALQPVNEDRFRNPTGQLSFRSGDEFELHFRSQNEIELKSMDGNTERYRRARPHVHTVEEMKVLTGRYESDELKAVIDVASIKDGLSIRLNDAPDKVLELRAVERDAFQRGMMIVRFRRDAAGKVKGFDYSNPLLRNIRFTRLSESAGGR